MHRILIGVYINVSLIPEIFIFDTFTNQDYQDENSVRLETEPTRGEEQAHEETGIEIPNRLKE